jgi:hypothetical protein
MFVAHIRTAHGVLGVDPIWFNFRTWVFGSGILRSYDRANTLEACSFPNP